MPSNTSEQQSFRLGAWLVQPNLGRVSNSSRQVKLEPRAMDLLVYLSENHGKVVSRRRIVDEVWRQEFVGDAAVTGTIKKLRKALGDDARNPRYIETIAKRGYRLLPQPLDLVEVVAGPSGAFRIGEWLVEPGRNRMSKGDSTVELEHATMDVLLCLAERAGETVARNDLDDRVRRTEPVSDLTVGRRIADLQEALGGGGQDPDYIEAVPKRGFRLAAAVGFTEPGATVTPFPGLRGEIERPVFVARQAELARLEGFLDQAIAGNGRVAFVTGEAGTGKTALLQEAVHRVQAVNPELVAAIGMCSAQTGSGDAYGPWRRLLALLTGDVESGTGGGFTTGVSRNRLRAVAPIAARAVAEHGRDLVGTVIPGAALLARTEAASAGGASWLQPLRELVRRKASLPPDAALQQAAVFMQVTRVLATVAGRKPLLLVLEDLHWADAGSIALLFHVSRELAGHKILVLGSFRPTDVALGRGDRRHPLEPVMAELRGHHSELTVELGQQGDRAFVDALVDSEPNRLDNRFRDRLFRQTAGHALFTVEVLRTLQDQEMLVRDPEGSWVEGTDLDWASLPARVEGILGARVGRLSEHLRELLTVASVEGEDFTAEVVAEVCGIQAREAIRLLSRDLATRHRLVRARGVRAVSAGRMSEFQFSHVLFQRYIYGTLNEVERVRFHEDVAIALERLYGEGADEIAPQLARHYEEAGLLDKAINCLYKAGVHAARMTANQEAIGHLTKALELLSMLPQCEQRDRTELALQIAVQNPLITVSGWGDPRVEKAVERAHHLVDQIGDESQLVPVLFQLGVFEGCARSVPRGIALGERMLAIAEEHGDSAEIILAHCLLGLVHAAEGDPVSSRDHYDKLLSAYDPRRHHALALLSGLDPAVAAMEHLTWVTAHLGYLDQAIRHKTGARKLAEELGHPHSLSAALSTAMLPHLYRLEYEQAREQVEAFGATIQAHGFGSMTGFFESYSGLFRLAGGQVDQAVEQCARGLSLQKLTGMKFGLSGALWILATVHRAAGNIDLALAALDEADELIQSYGEKSYQPGLLLLRAEILLETEGAAAAEPVMLESLNIARRRQARLYELNAAMALASLWLGQGRHNEARELLSPVYNWFTEGLDTAPLIAAKQMLASLDQNE